ncbi:MAG TPA: fibronectin type III domain-containing protein [Anaerolineae bacterium]|nr:fibronectin type III domain-containing protein [Anaerolineae bacterium]
MEDDPDRIPRQSEAPSAGFTIRRRKRFFLRIVSGGFVVSSLVLTLLPLVLAPARASHTLAVVQSAPFSFTAAGDYGFGSDAAATLRGMGAAGAVFNLALGDMSYSNNRRESDWCQFVKDNLNAGAGRPTGDPFGETFPFQLIVGNHENEPHQDDGYIDNYAACLPDRMNSVISPYGEYAREYYFDYQNARVILVGADNADGADPYDYVVGSNHYTWLRDRIVEAKNAGKWVIVGMHKVCVTMGVKTCEIGSDLMNLLIDERVDLVLQGHEHNYQRSKQLTCATVGSFNSACVADDGADGVYTRGAGSVFVIAGTGGAGLYNVSVADAEAGYFARWMGLNVNPRKGMLKVTVSDISLSAQFVGSTAGSFTDFFTINAPEPTPTPTATATPTATDTPTSTDTGTPTASATPGPSATPTLRTPTPTPRTPPPLPLEVLGTPEAMPLASLAIVTWQTNLEADSRVRFDLSSDGCSDPWSGVITSTAYVVSHSVVLVGLQPNTAYCYEIQSSNGNSTTAWIAGDPFTTLLQQFNVYLPLAIKAWEAPGPIRIAPYGDRTPKILVFARLLSLLEQMANAIYSIQGMK